MEFKMKPKIYDPHYLLVTAANLPDETYALDRDYAFAKAKALRLDVVEADPNTLQLDFDTENQWDRFLNQLLPTFMEFIHVQRVWWTESVNGHKHVYIKLTEPLTAFARIALQAAFGSDPVRELLCLMSEIQSDSKILLFEKKDMQEVVIFARDGYQPLLDEPLQPLLLTVGDPDVNDAQELGEGDVTFDVNEWSVITCRRPNLYASQKRIR